MWRPTSASLNAGGQFKPEYEKFSGYFNLDYGTGKIRGVYLQGNEAVRPIFAAWLGPFKEMGAATLTINGIGATDHNSFDAIGLPGFQFLRDFMETNPRTAHTNMDVYDHVLEDDLKQSAAVAAPSSIRPQCATRNCHERPQPSMHQSDLSFDQTTNKNIFRLSHGFEYGPDLMTL